MKSKIMLLALAVFLTVMACTKKNSTTNTNVTPPSTTRKIDYQKYALMGLDSPFLRIDSANKMIGSYLASCSTGTELKTLIVDADALRYYLSNTDIKHVKLMFAHKMSYINSGHNGQACGMDGEALTIVIAGYDANEDYIYSPQGAVMDFCQPCPNKCPEAGTAQYDLFPPNQL